ncbi:MAG: hypothetical protein F9K40_05695 [Kofleriaceae bacterium]|nr:MAG: hypothetical protein F9K40_05695 [Kofleriaceae bacterium]
MSKKLNRVDDEGVLWAIGRARKLIENRRSARQLWEGHFELATHLYQQDGARDEIRESFVLAAEHGLEMFEQRGEPAGESRTPWDFGLVLGVVMAFGTPEQRSRAGAVERWKWFHPEKDFYLLLADTLSQIQAFLSGRFDRTAAERVVGRCNAENADRDSKRYNGPLVEALLAIDARDPQKLQAALATMVKEHEYRAMRGPLQGQADGLVAVLPLGLVRVARESGLSCSIESSYVPLDLLG